MAQWGTESSTSREDNRIKRVYEPDPNVYLDSIGQPRGIPNEFKARDEIKRLLSQYLCGSHQKKCRVD